jgi:Holliday junction resolvase RusA-like endonuclease
MLFIVLSGQLVSGKNQIQIAVKNGRIFKYPNARFKMWHRESMRQVLRQFPALSIQFTNPAWLKVQYTPGDRIRRDATGMLDAIFRLMEDSGIIADDSLFKSISWLEMPLNRENPGAEINIGEL